MNLKTQYDAAVKAATTIFKTAEAEGRELTADEQTEFDAKTTEATDLKGRIETAVKNGSFMTDFAKAPGADATEAKSGENVALKTLVGAIRSKATSEAVSVKAATTVHTTVESIETSAPEAAPSIKANVRSLFTVEPSNSNKVSYWVSLPKEGSAGPTKEGEVKNPLHFPKTKVLEEMGKITGYIKVTDELEDDEPLLVAAIKTDLHNEVEREEEAELINGSGEDGELKGLMNVSGVQTLAPAAGETANDNLYLLGDAQAQVNQWGFNANTLIVNPVDLRKFRRLESDKHAYIGVVKENGLTFAFPVQEFEYVVTSSEVPVGTAIVLDPKRAGSIRVKAGAPDMTVKTGFVDDDFIRNQYSLVMEKRESLVIKQPLAVCIVTLAA